MGSVYKYRDDNIINSDYYLNVSNSYHVSYLRNLGINNITLSVEDSIDTIGSIVNNVGNNNIEVIYFHVQDTLIYC